MRWRLEMAGGTGGMFGVSRTRGRLLPSRSTGVYLPPFPSPILLFEARTTIYEGRWEE